MKAEPFDTKKFEAQTSNILKNPDVRDWLKHFKSHPKIRYFSSSTVAGKGTDSGAAYFDGVKEPFRIIDEHSLFANHEQK